MRAAHAFIQVRQACLPGSHKSVQTLVTLIVVLVSASHLVWILTRRDIPPVMIVMVITPQAQLHLVVTGPLRLTTGARHVLHIHRPLV